MNEYEFNGIFTFIVGIGGGTDKLNISVQSCVQEVLLGLENKISRLVFKRLATRSPGTAVFKIMRLRLHSTKTLPTYSFNFID